MTSNQHHPISPSRARRVELCPASLRLEAEAAMKGLAVEEHAEAAQEGSEDHEDVAERDTSASWKAAACQDFLDCVAPPAGRLFEYRESQALLNDEDGQQLTYGTMDYVATYPDHYVIVDFKMGRGDLDLDHVEYQLALYAAAILGGFQESRRETVIAYVYQPELNFSQSWIHTRQSSAETIVRFKVARHLADDPFAKPEPSFSACRYCTAKSICGAWKEQLPAVLPKPGEILPAAPSEVARLLAVATLASTWSEAVKKHAKRLFVDGLDIPGWRLKTQRRRRIHDPMGLLERMRGVLSQADVDSAVRASLEKLRDAYVETKLGIDDSETAKHWKEEFDGIVAEYSVEQEISYLARCEVAKEPKEITNE